MDGFRSDHSRYHLDADLLVGMALTELRAIGAGQSAAYAEFERLALRVKDYLAGARPGAGLRTVSSTPTSTRATSCSLRPVEFAFIDFDHCGFGWRGVRADQLLPGSGWRARTSEEVGRTAGRATRACVPSPGRTGRDPGPHRVPWLLGHGRLAARGQLERCRRRPEPRCASRASTGSVKPLAAMSWT